MKLSAATPIPLQANSGFLDRINGFLAWSTTVLLIFAAITIATMIWRTRRVRRLGQLPPEELQHWRSLLVEAVGEASRTQGTHVTLRGFWRGKGLTRAQRFVILEDLIRHQVLYVEYSSDSVVRFFEHVFWDLLCFPVGRVRLSELDWHRLASGTNPDIVAGGDVIVVNGSPGAGVLSRSARATQTLTSEVTPELVAAIAAALRSDGQALVPGHPLRQQAEEYAASLEREGEAGRWATAGRVLKEVVSFASNSASLWATTLDLLGQ